jgi:hypothetical protein
MSDTCTCGHVRDEHSGSGECQVEIEVTEFGGESSHPEFCQCAAFEAQEDESDDSMRD